MFNGQSVLVTGGTGTFGKAITSYLLKNFSPKKIIILSRDEMKQWEMQRELEIHNSKLRFFIGDVRDRERLYRAFVDVDYVIHAAAMKIVPSAEYNPFEYIKTNINGAINIVDASIDCKVKKLVALSTDKASSPVNLYGATKLVSDKIFSAANNYSSAENTKFSVVRYGNVMGSRGSVIPFFWKLRNKSKIPITDTRMTRFMITIDQGISLVHHAFENMFGGEIYVKKIPSMNILEIKKAINPNAKIEMIGVRPGEKIHEEMISEAESQNTVEFDDYYKIIPTTADEYLRAQMSDGGVCVPDQFRYSSDTNPQIMDGSTLRKWIDNNCQQWSD